MSGNKKWNKYKDFLKTGDWHIHTNFTDGENSPLDFFQQALRNNLRFLFFSEHCRKSMTYNYLEFKEEVIKASLDFPIHFAAGVEAKVLDKGGDLDIASSILNDIDLVTFSFHGKLFKTKDNYKKALINSMKNPVSEVWGHPTSYHNSMNFSFSEEDWDEIYSNLYQENICYEINKRYALPTPIELELLRKNKVNIIFSSDAHNTSQLLTLKDIRKFNRLTY
jgi:histidinol phosphatase-like PHP family hydrolase